MAQGVRKCAGAPSEPPGLSHQLRIRCRGVRAVHGCVTGWCFHLRASRLAAKVCREMLSNDEAALQDGRSAVQVVGGCWEKWTGQMVATV